jgi:hypothetical protein
MLALNESCLFHRAKSIKCFCVLYVKQKKKIMGKMTPPCGVLNMCCTDLPPQVTRGRYNRAARNPESRWKHRNLNKSSKRGAEILKLASSRRTRKCHLQFTKNRYWWQQKTLNATQKLTYGWKLRNRSATEARRAGSLQQHVTVWVCYKCANVCHVCP